MTLNNQVTEKFIVCTNIVKYEKILATYLTAEERRFVERRLAEERTALQELARSVPHRQNIIRKATDEMALA